MVTKFGRLMFFRNVVLIVFICVVYDVFWVYVGRIEYRISIVFERVNILIVFEIFGLVMLGIWEMDIF